MTRTFAWRLPFGATLLEAKLTKFRLFAPAQERVAVEIQGRSPVAMTCQGDGWFEADIACGVGTRYRYGLGSGEKVPDPASRGQAGDVHDWSMVIDPTAYQWRNPDWVGRPWRETIIYELHCGVMGGFDGAARALPRLADLGITAVELMPINDFPGSRNWGYDGVLPFAPDASYGSIADLKALIDAAHDHGLMIFLDVVYNHFGPEGNYLALYAPSTFRDDFHTPWGAGIDFRGKEVRRFFTENTLYWLMEYRFDGLRFDAVHAIGEADWLDEMAGEIRATVEPGRHVHLMLEHDGNVSSHLRRDFNAQWNDDLHHVLHGLLTGENEGYYVDYIDAPATKLAKGLAEGFIYQGEASAYRRGERRGTSSVDLPPTSFVFFLQNHDQVGNRAFGERLTVLSEPAALEAAIAVQILAPHIPLLFMGEEDASPTPFLFFCDYRNGLADAVRKGRRREFARFPAFADATQREMIPDPIAAETFERSVPQPDPRASAHRFALYKQLLAIRRTEVVPRLDGTRTLNATALGPAAALTKWRMGDGAILTLAVNLGIQSVPIEPQAGEIIFEGAEGVAHSVCNGRLPGQATIGFLERPQ